MSSGELPFKAFAEAARNTDAIAEERGMDAALAVAGLEPATAVKIAAQRALRLALIVTGDRTKLEQLAAKPLSSPDQDLELSDEQGRLMELFTMSALDAMALTSLAEKQRDQW